MNGKRSNPSTYPGYKKLISAEFIEPLIQEVEEERQHVMSCVGEAEQTVRAHQMNSFCIIRRFTLVIVNFI